MKIHRPAPSGRAPKRLKEDIEPLQIPFEESLFPTDAFRIRIQLLVLRLPSLSTGVLNAEMFHLPFTERFLFIFSLLGEDML